MGSCCCALFVGVTFLSAPIIRKQLREQAQANAEFDHLVETVGGMETIKVKAWKYSRWRWQQPMEDRSVLDSRMSSQVQLLDQQPIFRTTLRTNGALDWGLVGTERK